MKKLCIILAAALVVSLTAFGTLLMWNRSEQYSHHRWFEGYREDVIYDVLENYAYPGASAESVIETLGEGSEADPALLARILAFGGWQDGDDVRVLVYNIEGVNGRVTDYLAVICRGGSVVQTVLVSDE